MISDYSLPPLYFLKMQQYNPYEYIIHEIPVKTQQEVNILKIENPSEDNLTTVINNKRLNKVYARLRKYVKELHTEKMSWKKTHWTYDEDLLLIRFVEEEKISWSGLCSHFPGRTQSMCYSRYRHIRLTSKIKKWGVEDEKKLVELVSRLGPKWKKISQEMPPEFTPKHLRDHYNNKLRPNLNTSDFSIDEDITICKIVLEYGKDWKRILQEFPDRSERTIKSRYLGKLKEIIDNVLLDMQNF